MLLHIYTNNMAEMTEMTATEFKKKFSKALLKLEPENIDLDAVRGLLKKVKITKKSNAKRPLTAYNIFMKDALTQVKMEQPELKQMDVMREAVLLWNKQKVTD